METFLLSVPYGRLTGVLVGLFLFSILYALFLEWSEQRWGFVSAYTWLTVVIGVAYTLVGLAVLLWQAAVLGLVVFGASCLPIIARSIINDLRERKERMEHWEKRGD